MIRSAALITLLIAPICSGCGPSAEDCDSLCDWWSQSCTAEPKESCVDDCLDADTSDVDHALEQCLGTSPSGCKGASCCLRFVYDEYYFQTNCL